MTVDESEYLTCDKEDWTCKSEKSNACYQKASECWNAPHDDYEYSDCQAINDMCSKIWSQ
jgi:hypothetical protein